MLVRSRAGMPSRRIPTIAMRSRSIFFFCPASRWFGAAPTYTALACC